MKTRNVVTRAPLRSLLLATLCLLVWPAHADEPRPRQVSVSAQAEVKAVPDAATVNMAVETRAAKLADAKAQVAAKVGKLLKVVDALGISRKHVQTANLYIRPDYDYPDSKDTFTQPKLVGYYVKRQITVDLENLSQLGPLMEQAIKAGINSVSPPQFRSTAAEALRQQALKLAAQRAQKRAEVMAHAVGAKLGRVMQLISQANVRPMPRVAMMSAVRMKADSAGAEQSYAVGEISYQVSVQASFELVD